MAQQSGSYCKKLSDPDERREFRSHGHLDVVNFSDEMSLGRGVFEPGWKWSNDVKPLAKTASCEAPHFGYCLSGSMVVHMNNGIEFTIKAGDAFQIPPGHDAWVTGNEPCVLIDVTGFKTYAKAKAS